jgi:hypothetical protein
MQLQGAAARTTVSRMQFREIYAVFITDLAARGHAIAAREMDRVLRRRGFEPSDVAAYAALLLQQVADSLGVEVGRSLLAVLVLKYLTLGTKISQTLSRLLASSWRLGGTRRCALGGTLLRRRRRRRCF